MSEMDAFYDPDPLEAGTRVRVRLGGECRAWVHAYKALMGGECERGKDGDAGVVHRILAGDEHAGHPYSVRFAPEAGADHPFCLASFARAELERR